MAPKVLAVLAVPLLLVACSTGDGSGSGTSDGSLDQFELVSSPEFINRMIPGLRPMALVTVTGTPGGDVALAGTASNGATVELVPSSVGVDDVSELWVEVPDVAGESTFTVTVTATRGDVERTIILTGTAVPGTDDLAEAATDIAEFFLVNLAGKVPGLPADQSGLVNGSPVAGLLVVTHYAWFTDQLEIGLAWHVMVAPDDWSELYVRPRGQLVPTAAYRLSSWSTAISGGDYTVTEIAAPAEVTR
jgi:hypothetical protein